MPDNVESKLYVSESQLISTWRRWKT